jgi:hypothetical protein
MSAFLQWVMDCAGQQNFWPMVILLLGFWGPMLGASWLMWVTLPRMAVRHRRERHEKDVIIAEMQVRIAELERERESQRPTLNVQR